MNVSECIQCDREQFCEHCCIVFHQRSLTPEHILCKCGILKLLTELKAGFVLDSISPTQKRKFSELQLLYPKRKPKQETQNKHAVCFFFFRSQYRSREKLESLWESSWSHMATTYYASYWNIKKPVVYSLYINIVLNSLSSLSYPKCLTLGWMHPYL